jgi:predicted transposase/invertase (TIGR01784 family)
MLGLNELKQTRVYQEAKQDGQIEEKQATVSRMTALGFPIEQIAQAVDLPIREVQKTVQQESQTKGD